MDTKMDDIDKPKPGKSPKDSPSSSPEKKKEVKEEKVVAGLEDPIPGPSESEEGAMGWMGGWLSTTLTTAKAKSTEMFQYLKQDLTEFGDSVQEAGRDLKEKLKLEENAMTAVNSVGEKVNTILEQVSSIFGVAPEDDETTEALVFTKDGPLILSRIQARIHSIAMNEDVFLKDPDTLDLYETWLATFDLEEKQEQMNDLLSNSPHLQLHYTQLVPDKVSHLVFWHRFFYQVHLISTEEESMAYQEALLEKASKRQDSESPTNSQENERDIVNISEEEQRRLLAEYELEIQKYEGSGSSAGHSRRSSDNQNMSSSSSSSFAFVTNEGDVKE